jgi:hypothetical protein
LLILSGPRWFPEEKIAYEEEALNEVRNNRFPFAEVVGVVPGFGSADKLPDLLRNPWPEDASYWKLRYKGSYQDLFFITTLEDVSRFVETMQRIAGAHGYDPAEMGIYIQPIEYASACHLEFDFYYDGNSPTEVEKIEGLFDEAIRELLNLGAHFTRPYGKRLADLVYEKAGSYTMLLKKTKSIFDPNNIMNPGKLCF